MSSGTAAVLEERVVDGRYHVESLLGRGAMGVVYRARDEVTGREVALKRLQATGSAHSGGVQSELRFRREFHTIAGLEHPGIVKVYDFGRDEVGPYYTMELLDGDDLRQLAPCEVRRTCALMRQIASALALLHARRLLHRDLKARNVRCDERGRARLLDFGVLATMGVSGEVAGTLPSIPPEAVRGLPLDGRADLFGLGALTYWLLTGRHAFRARSLAELERVWSAQVPPPSSFREGVPPAVDALVMSLLSIDPGGRPQDAAEVVARFDAAAELEPDPTLEVARSWVRSSSLVGRQTELDAMTERIEMAIGGRGGVVIVDAPSGVGKTRLLREAGLQGQVNGAQVVRARARSSATEPYAVIRKLGMAAAAAMPGEARLALTDHPLAGQVIEMLRDEPAPLSAVPQDPGEARLRRQEDLRQWFIAMSRHKPLLLLIDDLQRCDEASAAVLAALAHAAPQEALAIFASHRTDDEATPPKAVRELRRKADILKLEGLDPRGVEDLCVGLLGRVDGVGKLARWMHEVAGGSPLLCTELVRHLVEEGSLRYEQGSWAIPERFDHIELPAALGEAVELRLKRLDPLARRLAEALSLVSGRFDVELCAALIGEDDPSAVFDALDQLFVEEVLLEGERGIEFRHDSMREALRRRIDPPRLPALHAKVAAALEERSQDITAGQQRRLAEIGWHWMAAGERQRAAALLERAGLALFEEQSFADAIAPLEAAVEVYEEQGGHRKRILKLRDALTRAGVLSDHKVVRRHAHLAVEGYWEDAGLEIASSLSRFIGRRLSLLFGLLLAFVRWPFAYRRRAAPIDAFVNFVALNAYAASVRSLGFDFSGLRLIRQRARPLEGFANRVPAGASLLIENFVLLARGHYERVLTNAKEVHRIIDGDRLTPLTELDRTIAHGAADFMRASVLALQQDLDYRHYAASLRQLQMRFFDASVYNMEAFFHRLRGEESKARRNIERAELLGIQLGNMWVFESQLAWMSAIAYSFTGDALGMERTAAKLRRLVDEGFAVGAFVALMEAEQLRAQGRPEEAAKVAQTALQRCEPEQLLFRQVLEAARLDAWLSMGTYDRVIDRAGELLAPDFAEAAILTPVRIRVAATRVIALARHGREQDARRDLETVVALAKGTQSPLLLGLAHEAGALVFEALEDPALRRHHARRCAAMVSQTANPVLVARGDKLLAEAPRSEADDEAEPTVAIAPEPAATSVTDGAIVGEDTEDTVSVIFTHSGSDR